MSKPRPPYLQRERTRHGRFVWYVRKGDGPRTRIHGDYGSPDFWENYHRAVSGDTSADEQKPTATFNWLLKKYRASAYWANMTPSTRYKHEKIFIQVADKAGDEPLKHFTREAIIDGRERRAKTPFQSRHFLDALRHLFQWAVDDNVWDQNPTIGIKNLKRPKGKGFPIWTEAEVTAYEERWPLGTHERVWLDMLLYTGTRRGDAWKLGPQHVQDGMLFWQTEKSGETVLVVLPIMPVLGHTLNAGPIGERSFIISHAGRSFASKESFGNAFSKAARKAGVAKSAHGLRKVAATRAADNGASEKELEAIFGWRGGKMAALYTEEADRKRLSIRAAHKLEKKIRTPALRLIENETEASIPAPNQKEPRTSTKKL